jgi:hypothetical protein
MNADLDDPARVGRGTSLSERATATRHIDLDTNSHRMAIDQKSGIGR